MATVTCPHCQQPLRIPANFSGGRVQCPQCGGVLSLPGTSPPAPATPLPPTPPFRSSPPRPAAPQRSTTKPKQKRQIPLIAWILGGLFGAMFLGFLMCAGLVALAINRAGKVDARFEGKTLLDARAGHQTRLIETLRDAEPPEPPPVDLFDLVQYSTDLGPMPAYLGVDAKDQAARGPAMIWLFGGFSNGIGSTAWEAAPASNDQSASAFREAGLIMMYPALRGGCGAPGSFEGCYGEVNDVLAAADFLASQPGVDPNRIYLGGHSTGGSLALLCAAASKKKFRAVFAFGPVDRLSGYGQESLPYNIRNQRECELRDPIRWLHAIETPTFAIEGSQGNSSCIFAMRLAPKSDHVKLHLVNGADHFNILSPITPLLAEKVAADDGPQCNITLSNQELNEAFGS